ncbi:MAG: metal-sulfur cluster assembly factor [Streptosporangiaceae bacterium]
MITSSDQSPAPEAGREPLGLMSALGRHDSPALLRELLRDVIDPEIGINIVDLGLVYEARLPGDGVAVVVMTLTTPGCPLSGYLDDAIHECLFGTPGVSEVDVQIVWDPPWDPDEMLSDWAKEQLGWRR